MPVVLQVCLEGDDRRIRLPERVLETRDLDSGSHPERDRLRRADLGPAHFEELGAPAERFERGDESRQRRRVLGVLLGERGPDTDRAIDVADPVRRNPGGFVPHRARLLAWEREAGSLEEEIGTLTRLAVVLEDRRHLRDRPLHVRGRSRGRSGRDRGSLLAGRDPPVDRQMEDPLDDRSR